MHLPSSYFSLGIHFRSLCELLSEVALHWECGHLVGPSDLVSAAWLSVLLRAGSTVQPKHMGLEWAKIQSLELGL